MIIFCQHLEILLDFVLFTGALDGLADVDDQVEFAIEDAVLEEAFFAGLFGEFFEGGDHELFGLALKQEQPAFN